MTEYKNILFQVDTWGAILIFNRPQALNAMNAETLKEIQDAISICKRTDSIKVLVLTGAGEKAFVAGADIREMQNLRPSESLMYQEAGQEAMRMLETLPKPTIAVVNGYALGGGMEIALACDMRFASEKARFGQPEILLGSIPGWGGTQRLPRVIGMGRAKELIFSGEQIDAKRAYEIGLVNRVYPVDQLLPEAIRYAVKIAGLPAFALKMAKYSMNFGIDMSVDNATRLEAECCAQCFSMQDQKEGMTAFLEKRKPSFTGR